VDDSDFEVGDLDGDPLEPFEVADERVPVVRAPVVPVREDDLPQEGVMDVEPLTELGSDDLGVAEAYQLFEREDGFEEFVWNVPPAVSPYEVVASGGVVRLRIVRPAAVLFPDPPRPQGGGAEAPFGIDDRGPDRPRQLVAVLDIDTFGLEAIDVDGVKDVRDRPGVERRGRLLFFSLAAHD
jgi:hypothetical protein